MKKNVLILGSGGREHALAWAFAKDDNVGKVYCAPGNGGTNEIAENINVNLINQQEVFRLAKEKKIDLTVVGPEKPLADGIVDSFRKGGLRIFGPDAYGAQLESSKLFARDLMAENNIPHPDYYSCNTREDVETLKGILELPLVLKADGLAAGKGVLILEDLKEAKKELKAMVADAKFGKASATVVVEEFLSGIELSVFVLTDGDSYKILPSAKDYKRIGEGDTGLNTGGMGAISPVPFADRFFIEKVETEIIKPTIQGLKEEGIIYHGFIFIGLIVCGNDIKVIEYNVRMGDPETEVVIPRIKSDLLYLFKGIGDGTFSEKDLHIDEDTAATVMLVSGGYPEKYEKGKVIDDLSDVEGSIVFHAGTRQEKDAVLTNGGRVLAVTSFGKDIEDALAKSFTNAKKIKFEKKYYRKDIGFDLR